MPRALKNLDISLGLATIPVQLFTVTSSQRTLVLPRLNEQDLAELPEVLPRLTSGELPGLCHRVLYKTAADPA